jgi:hypothetical protein
MKKKSADLIYPKWAFMDMLTRIKYFIQCTKGLVCEFFGVYNDNSLKKKQLSSSKIQIII